MRPDRSFDDCGDESARLLPWFVNGTLNGDEARRVRMHLESCERCRDDAARLETMGALLRAPSSVEHTPQAGLRKLMARVYPQAAGEEAVRRSAATQGLRPAPRSLVRWLAVAVVAQAVAIAVLVGADVLAPAPSDAPAVFHTLTSAGPEGLRLRVVFTPAMTLGELRDLLQANGLVVAAGPSEAGIYTLAVQPPGADAQARADVLARLRADARVRFAEAVGMDAATR